MAPLTDQRGRDIGAGEKAECKGIVAALKGKHQSQERFLNHFRLLFARDAWSRAKLILKIHLPLPWHEI